MGPILSRKLTFKTATDINLTGSEIPEEVDICEKSAQPILDAENEQQFRETKAALNASRSQNEKVERLKQENDRLACKRNQMKQQCEKFQTALKASREQRADLCFQIAREEKAEDNLIREYEDNLESKATQFRSHGEVYNKGTMTLHMKSVTNNISELEVEVSKHELFITELKKRLSLEEEPDVPNKLPSHVGQDELLEKLKSVTKTCEELRRRLFKLKNKDGYFRE